MTNKSQIGIRPVPKDSSTLEKFQLAFEYDRTWSEAKHTIQLRPAKSNRR